MTKDELIERRCISALVDNEAGVLARVIGLFSGRGYNIDSLTVTEVATDSLEVNLIPFTWDHTSLAERRVGDPVNLESDILGKYVARLLGGAERSSGVTMARLADAGFLG